MFLSSMKTVVIFAIIFSVASMITCQGEFAAGLAGQAANSNKSPGQPIFGVNGGGSGNNGRNWNVGGTAGVGTKVWESNNGRHSVGAGVAGSQSFGRHEGQSWRSKPSYGGGAAYTYKFGK